jgi:division protein CdvB (Snf7/Vps24/ESCRT-III family)
MDKIFGKKPTLKEQVRENERTVNKQARELDRERLALQRQEKQITAEIKKAAKEGNEQAARILAKSLIRNRQQQTQMLTTSVQMKGVNTAMKSQVATAKMAEAMGTSANIMGKMNAQINPAQVQQIMANFERQNEMMAMKDEMISDTLDSAMGVDGEDEEVDQAMGEVLDSLGIELGGKLSGVNAGRGKMSRQQAAEEEDLGNLNARMAALQRPGGQ